MATVASVHVIQSTIDQGYRCVHACRRLRTTTGWLCMWTLTGSLRLFVCLDRCSNLFEGRRHQISRDIAFAVCDAAVLSVAATRLVQLYRQDMVPRTIVRRHLSLAVSAGVTLLVLYRIVLL